MTRGRSSIKGAASFRRLIRALPDSSNIRLVTFLNAAGPPIAAKMKELVPVLAVPRANRTPGAARNSISWKVLPKSLNLKVGELTKKDILFYAHILDVGRKGKAFPVRKGPRKGHFVNVRVFQGLHILSKTRGAFRLETLPGYRTIMDDILLRASQGAGND